VRPCPLVTPRTWNAEDGSIYAFILHPSWHSQSNPREFISSPEDDGASHRAEVTTSSLFEAVAQGLSALRKNEWVEGIEERFGVVKVSVADVRVEHQVKIADFTKWLERPGRTPREITQRQKIRAILGMSVTR